MIGGAAGDALGYAVEFLDNDAIRRHFGDHGITEYSIDRLAHKAVISDDTQMTLFTAAGLLNAYTRHDLTGMLAAGEVKKAYAEWYRTQTEEYIQLTDGFAPAYRENVWLMDIPELYKRRAPGNTCLSAL